MLRLFAELLPSLSLGYVIGRYRPTWTRPLAMPLVRFGVPISLMGLLLRGGLTWSLMTYAAMAIAGILLMLGLSQTLAPARQWIGNPALELGTCVGNTAYFGIPVALALLPAEALQVSIGYDFGATLLAWGLGPFWLARRTNGTAEGHSPGLLRHVSNSPASRGLLGALIVQLTPWQGQITDLLWLPSRVVIVLALTVVGMRLGAIRRGDASEPALPGLSTTLLCKLLLYPALMLLITWALPFSVVSRDALVLQAAAPTAISVLLMAEEAKQDHHAAAILVLRSTLLGLVTVPLWWWLLQGLGTPGR